jgi:hypothetical protein
MPLSATRLRQLAIFAAAVGIVCVVARHLIGVQSVLLRAIDGDETELLHAGWLMHQGLRLYRDFAEDHAPFLFVILKWMVPAAGTAAFPRLDLYTFVARARTFTSLCGLLGVGAVAVLAYRASRSLIAPLVTIAAVMASPEVWLRGVVQVRNDPPAVLLFWLGALLLLGGWRSERVRALCAGTGIGLVAIAALWNPKWPLESLVLGVVYLIMLWRSFRRGPSLAVLAITPPLACVGAALACIAVTVPLGDYVFFTFRYNQILSAWMATNPYLARLTKPLLSHSRAYMFCAPAFKGIWPVIAIVILLALLSSPSMRRRLDTIDWPAHWVLLALGAAATIEIRFLYPYPIVWAQYYVMWSLIAACLYGTISAALVRQLPGDGMRLAATVVVVLVALFKVDQAMPLPGGAVGWPLRSYMQRNLRGNETIWVSAEVHPIGAADAGYYWFATNDLVPFSLEYAGRHPGTPLPAIADRDLPVCRAERGLQPDLRYVSGGLFLRSLPGSSRCLGRLIASGRAVRTPVADVWDLHPEKR